MKSYLERMRQKVEKDLLFTPRWKFFSPAIYTQYRVMLPILQKHAHGTVIDIGCGYMPYRPFLQDSVTSYDGVDLYNQSSGIKFHLNAENLAGIEKESYDTAIMVEVLEHLPHPWVALAEAYKVLKKGGTIILSVPHLSRLHDLPLDYYRYTESGLCLLLSEAGFIDVEIVHKGGIFSFIGHQVSTLIITLVWGIPVVKDIVFFINGWLVTRLCFALDSVLDSHGLIPLGYVAVGRRA